MAGRARSTLRCGTWWLVLLAAVLGALPARAMHHRRDARAEVLRLEEQWRRAQLNADVPVMDRMLADDYLGVSPYGLTSTKAQTLERVAAHRSTFRRLDVTSEKVKFVGAVAIVTSLASVDASFDGRPVEGEFRYTRVYHRVSPGVWKITSFEATPVRVGGLAPAQP